MLQTTPAPSQQDTALSVLKEVFGYQDFRGRQRQVIETVLGGRDALVLMPTGGGKSLCYQIPALLRPGTAVVVSPLIALMNDQVEALRHYGVRAACLNSGLDPAARFNAERDLAEGRLDLVYVAPERLLRDTFLQRLEAIPLALFAIDEAHCVSQWGHDFRPEYLQLDVLRKRFPQVPRVALTATADTRTRAEIAQQLLSPEHETFIDSFDRPNIRYRVGLRHNARRQLLVLVRDEHPGQSGIVYCPSRKRTEDTAAWLREQGFQALPYHAGLDAATRHAHQARFIHEDGVIMVATIAFGMGIDKPDVRFVAHLGLPRSIEAYYQETGRAGRDGLPADAWMIYGLSDIQLLRQLLADSELPDAQRRAEHQRLEALLAYCEYTGCRRPALLNYFGEQHPGACGHCDNCLQPPATWDATEPARKALSCVYRTGQRFGAGHVVDVLLGRETERVLRFAHHRVSTFGIGDDLGQAEWHSVLRQLLAAGYLEADPEGHGGLRLAEASRPLLRGEIRLEMRRDLKPPAAGRSARKRAARDEALGPDFETLRRFRLELARQEGVPPYVIFHDATLAAMLAARPRTLAELGAVSGVGRHKLEKYGTAFLEVLLGLEQPADPAPDITASTAPPAPEKSPG